MTATRIEDYRRCTCGKRRSHLDDPDDACRVPTPAEVKERMDDEDVSS